MSAGNPPPSRRTVRPASDTRRRMATGPAASQARCYPTRHARDRQRCPRSPTSLLPKVVHPQGEAKALEERGPSPIVPPIRPEHAITQLPDLGLVIQCNPWCRPASRDRRRAEISEPAELGPSAAIVQPIMKADGGVVEGRKSLEPGGS